MSGDVRETIARITHDTWCVEPFDPQRHTEDWAVADAVLAAFPAIRSGHGESGDARGAIRDFLKAVDRGYLGKMPDGFNVSAFVTALRVAAEKE